MRFPATIVVLAAAALIATSVGMQGAVAAPVPGSAAAPIATASRAGLTQGGFVSTRSEPAAAIRAAAVPVDQSSPIVQPLTVGLGLANGDGVDGMAVADLNGDTKPDLALVEHVSGGGTTFVTYLATAFGNGDRTFDTPTRLILSDGGRAIALTGAQPVPVVVADIKNAKRHDIVVGVPGRNEVLVYFDQAAGTYAATPTVIPLPGPAVQLATADLGNGHIDIVVLVAGVTPQVVTLIGDGSGAFPASAVATFTAHLTANDLAVLPLSPGGKPDIVVSGHDDGNAADDTGIGILRNDGHGVFPTAATMIDGGSDVTGFQVGKFSASGNVDLLVVGDHCNHGTGAVYCQTLLTGNGDGTFAAPATAAAVPLASAPTRGASPNVPLDLDHDGKADAVWAHGTPGSGSPTMLTTSFGDGQGAFATSEWVGTGAPNTQATGVIAADLTGSGTPDLVVDGDGPTGLFTDVTGGVYIIPASSTAARVYESGRVIEPGVNFVGNTPTTAIGNFSGSGHLDIATTSVGPGALHVVAGNGDGSFGPDVTTPVALNAGIGPATGDFDGDGHSDLAWATASGTGIEFMLGTGSGGFAAPVVVPGAGTGNTLVAGDVNGDGRPDLTMEYADGSGRHLQSFVWDTATKTFDAHAPTAPFLNQPQGPRVPALGVFTTSGHVDAALVTALPAHPTIPEVVVFPGDGKGAFDVASAIAVAPESSAFTVGPLAVGDMNTDGHDDLVFQGAGKVSVALGNGDGTFRAPTVTADPWVFPGSTTATDLVVAHLSSPTQLDVVEVGTGPAGTHVGDPIVFPGNPDGTLGAPQPIAAANAPVSTLSVARHGSGGLDDLVVGQWGNSGHTGGLLTILLSAGGASLTASAVTGPAGPVAPGQTITSSWTVTNTGSRVASGRWSDAVYLGTSPTFDATDELVGTVVHAGDVDPGASYTAQLSATLPGIPAGARYLIVVPDRSGQKASAPTGVGASSAFTVNAVPILTVGGPAASGAISAGQVLYFQVTPSVGSALALTGIFGAAGTARFAERFGAFPNPASGDADETYPTPSDPAEVLSVPSPTGGVYYVMLVGLSAAAGGQTYSVSASQTRVAVTGFSPSHFGGSTVSTGFTQCAIPGDPVCGHASLTVHGSGFTAATVVTLRSRSSALTLPSTVTFIDANTVVAQFATGAALPAGVYTVNASVGGVSADAVGAFVVGGASPFNCAVGSGLLCTASAPPVTVDLSTPSAFRPPNPGTVTVSWANRSGSDQPAPVIELVGTNAIFNDPTNGATTGQSEMQLLGVGGGAQAGVLAPGESGSITATFAQPTVGTSTFTFFTLDPTFVVDWSQARSDMQPSGMPTSEWNAAFANFEADAGSTLGTYNQLLDRAASYLSNIGERPNGDAQQEMNLELASADDYGDMRAIEGSGASGPGLTDVTNTSLAVTDPAGDVSIDLARFRPMRFLKQPDGSYFDPGNGPDSLTRQSDGSYHLTAPGGATAVWSSAGRLVSTRDTNGNATTYTSTPNGHLASSTGPNGETRSLTYDGAGRLTLETAGTGRPRHSSFAPDGTMSARSTTLTSLAMHVSVLPNGTGHAPLTITLPTGETKTLTYDKRDRLTSSTTGRERTVFAFGAFGEVTATDATGAQTTSWLNERGQIARVTDSLGHTTSYGFDGSGHLTSMVDPAGSATNWGYDGAGDLASQVDPDGNRTVYSHDGSGRLTAVTDPNGNTTSYTYDSHGNVVREQFADGTAQSFTYQANGLIATETTAAGHLIAFAYTPRLLVSSVTVDGAISATYAYNSADDPIAATNSSGTTTQVFDADGRVTHVTEPNGAQLSIAYDAAGRVTSESDASGYTLGRSYNAEGHLAALHDGAGVALAAYSYNAAGRIVKVVNGNGTSTRYVVDAMGRTTSLVNLAPGGSVTSQYDVTYNVEGWPVQVAGPDGTATYTYDADGRLVAANLPGGHTQAYTYDPNGNRTSSTVDGVQTAYTVNRVDEYTHVGGQSLAYDGDGNLVGESGTAGVSTFAFDAFDRATSLTTPSGTSLITYDGFSRRIAATRGATTTRYLPSPTDASGVFAELDGAGAVTAHHVDGPAGMIATVTAAGVPTYLATDTDRNVVATTDATGSVTATAAYAPFGAVSSSTGNLGAARFVGALGTTTEGNGLDFVRLRAYDPTLGRFVSRDAASPPGADRYTYADDSPLALVDFNGMEAGPPNENGVTTGLDRAGEAVEWLARAGLAIEIGAENVGKTLAAGGDEVLAETGEGIEAFGQAISQVTLVFDAGGELTRIAGGVNAIANGQNTNENFGSDIGLAALDSATLVSLGSPVALTPVGAVLLTADTVAHAGVFLINHTVAWSYELANDQFSQANWGPALRRHYPNGHIPSGLFRGSRNVNDHDPNDIYGPSGFGSQGWLAPGTLMPFAIDFANEDTATAPVQVVQVTETLAPQVDPATFSFGAVGFVGKTFTPPSGQNPWTMTVPDTASLSVKIEGSFDPSSRRISWVFTAIDPATGVQVSDPLAGFLAPDKTPPQGEGFVSYAVALGAGLPTGTVVNTTASVVFDANPALSTRTLTNTVDAGPPDVVVDALPATTPAGQLHVAWTGTDAPGSGVRAYDVYVSVDHRPLVLVAAATPHASISYATTVGHSYGFAVSARDNVGNGGGQPTRAVVTTTAVKPTTRSRSGYWMLGADGHVYGFGDAHSFGAASGPSVAMAALRDGTGYWTVDRTGRVSAFGRAAPHGNAPALRPGEAVAAIAATPTANGYWLFTNLGRAFAFGDARFFGDMSGARLNGPIVASVATPTGHGYYMVGSDGGIFSFGDAKFHGSMGGVHLNEPVVGLSPTPDNRGYWLVGTDGGVFAFNAPFRGSMGATTLNKPVNGLVAYGNGYLMVSSDGGIFDFSNKGFVGSLGATPPAAPIVGIAAFGT